MPEADASWPSATNTRTLGSACTCRRSSLLRVDEGLIENPSCNSTRLRVLGQLVSIREHVSSAVSVIFTTARFWMRTSSWLCALSTCLHRLHRAHSACCL